MTNVVNLSERMEKYLPGELAGFARKAGETAAAHGQKLYLVGGAVRDFLLEQTNLDLDLVVEGDAIELAQRLAEIHPAKITYHHHFNTAKLRWGRWSIDLTTARSETYSQPGALPTVKPGSVSDDLFRRDFTINAMAVHLSSGRCGELLDPYQGREDLKNKLIRILHEKSFIDDATRIWRALRYEQRLDFRMESATLRLLGESLSMLDTISADRIRYEVECVLQERKPEKVIHRADELKVLAKLLPALRGDIWLAEKFEGARRFCSPDAPPAGLYLSLLAYRTSAEETESLVARLRPTKALTQTLRDTGNLKGKLKSLNVHGLTPSDIHNLLHDHSSMAIIANYLACDLPTARQNIYLFLNELRHVKPTLTGDDLQRMGVTLGPGIGLLLQQLHRARLNGDVITRQDEESFVEKWLETTSGK